MPVTSISTTTQPPTTVTAAPTTTAPAGPEVVTVTAGQSVLTFTLPANTTPADREIYARYIEFLRVLMVTADPADPDSQELEKVFVDSYEQSHRERLRLWMQSGSYIRGAWDGHPLIVSNEVGVVRIEDCSLDTSARFDATGAVITPADLSPVRRVTILDNSDGPLKVRTFVSTGEPCVA